jgi:CelD/BcsL family acetyltransferase involved in cellulose biosynthesis
MSASHAAVELKIFDGIDEIVHSRPLWDELAASRQRNLPFCGPGFSIAALKIFHADDHPRVIVALADGQPQGLICLVDRRQLHFGITVREIGFPCNPHVIVNDMLLPADPVLAEALAFMLLDAALSLGEVSLILDHCECEEGTFGVILAAALRRRLRFDPPVNSRSLYFTAVDGSYNTYLQTRSGNHRRQVAKLAREAAKLPSFEIRRHRGACEIRAALPDWFAVESNSWQAGGADTKMSVRDKQFHAVLLDDLDPSQVGDLWIANLESQPVAALRMVGSADRTCVLTMHFDQKFKDVAPGLLVFDDMMRAAFDERLKEVDMHGRTQMFERWSSGFREHKSIRLYQPGYAGAALKAGVGLARGLRKLRNVS